MVRSAPILVPVLCLALANALIDVGTDGTDSMKMFDYNPGNKMVVCGCDKCGTTSLYNYVYLAIMGQPWKWPDTPPWIQDVLSPRWNGTFRKMKMHTSGWPDSVEHKIALVRDPQERLISAWKSKLACDSVAGHVNASDREWMLPGLYRLARVTPIPSCIDFETFVDLLKIIRDNYELWKLQGHFLPQQFGCFRTNPVDTWTVAAPISSPRIREAIDRAVGKPTGEDMGHVHASKAFWVDIPDKTQALLDEITADEYRALKDSFKTGDSASVHGVASRSCSNEACGVPCSKSGGKCVVDF